MAELSLPSAWDADAVPEREASLDEMFAHVLGQLMTGIVSPEEAVTEWARACDQEARHLYNLSQDYDYPSRARYEDELQELRDECDTWFLMAHMFSREDTISGPCPVVLDPSEAPGYGQMTSVIQQILTLTSSHNDLRRVSQVIAWLEDQSLRDLLRRSPGQLADSLDEFGTTAGYTRQEAIQNLRASITPSEVSSQDPDAHTWQIGPAAADHHCITEDEQLLSAVYTLLRAGSEPLAIDLCMKAACGWRAATICAVGWGLLPVGSASSQALHHAQPQKATIAADILARHGCSKDATSGYVAATCAVRERWRAACAAAAASAAQRSGTGSAAAVAARYERAIYGILAGSEEHCLGACTTWQDRMWVRGRAVLQSEPERRLREELDTRSIGGSTTPQKPRPWQRHILADTPGQLADAPDASRNGSVLDQVMILLEEIEATDGANARLHHTMQRLLVKAALGSMMMIEPSEHPLRHVLQRLLAFSELPAASASITHHRTRFASHLGLALVSFGAMPGSPEDTDRLWHTFSDSLPGWLLEAVNHTADVYISALTDHPEASSRELLPQYICLLRPSLTNVTLRRCFTALMPAPPANHYQRAQAYTEALTTLQTLHVDKMIAVQPPAHGCFESVLSPQAWYESSILLESLLHWFQIWHRDARTANERPEIPHLPRTTVRFDSVLCETVRASVHSNAISNIDRIAMVKWLLLPFQMRKDMLEPFLGGSGATAQACWVCTVQAVFVALDICRLSALQGVAQQYAAFSLVQHMFGGTYTSHFASATQQATDDDMDAASKRTLLQAVSARCEFQEQGEESQLLIALQRAVHELQEWQEALSAMDHLAQFSRAVTVAANDVFLGPNVAEALSAVAAVGSRDLLEGTCYVPPQLSGDMGIEMCVCKYRQAGGGAQAPSDVWGSSAAIDATEGMATSDAHKLASDIAAALNARLRSAVTWQSRGLDAAVQEAIEVQATAEPLNVTLDTPDTQPPAVVRFRVALSAHQVRATVKNGHIPGFLSDAVAVCMDIVTSSVADLVRGDILEYNSTSKLEVLSACALAPPDTWERAILYYADDPTRRIHAAHVHGDTLGRFSVLRALSGRMMLAELAMASSRLQIWGAQLGIHSGTLSDVWDVRDGLEGCGLCVSERSLEVMSASQLRELLANAELTMLHDAVSSGDHPH